MSLGPAGPDRFSGLLQLSVMRAMLGEITPEIRAVAVELVGREATVRVYHDGPASEEPTDAVDVADTEIRADFPSQGPDVITLDTQLVRCEAPERLRAPGQYVLYAFLRKEP